MCKYNLSEDLMSLTRYWSWGSICSLGMGRWLCWTCAPLRGESRPGRRAATWLAGRWAGTSLSWPPRPPGPPKICRKGEAQKKKGLTQMQTITREKIKNKKNKPLRCKTDLPGSLSMRNECSLPSLSGPCSGRLMTRRGLWLPVNTSTSREPLLSMTER